MKIYVHKNNQQLGPFTEEELKAQVASGAISRQDHVWWQGQATWLPLSQTPLAANLAPAPHSPPPIGVGPGMVGPHSSYQHTSNLALWSVISSVAGFFCFFPFIVGIILGHLGLAETKKNPAMQGRSLAITGLIIGYAGLALYLFCILILGLFFALGMQVKSTFKDLETQIRAAQAQDNTDSDSSKNDTDSSTNNAPSDSTTNSAPAVTP